MGGRLDGLPAPTGGLANLLTIRGADQVYERDAYHLVHGHRAVRERHGAEDDAKHIVPSSMLAKASGVKACWAACIVVLFFSLYCARMSSIVGAAPCLFPCEVFSHLRARTTLILGVRATPTSPREHEEHVQASTARSDRRKEDGADIAGLSVTRKRPCRCPGDGSFTELSTPGPSFRRGNSWRSIAWTGRISIQCMDIVHSVMDLVLPSPEAMCWQQLSTSYQLRNGPPMDPPGQVQPNRCGESIPETPQRALAHTSRAPVPDLSLSLSLFLFLNHTHLAPQELTQRNDKLHLQRLSCCP